LRDTAAWQLAQNAKHFFSFRQPGHITYLLRDKTIVSMITFNKHDQYLNCALTQLQILLTVKIEWLNNNHTPMASGSYKHSNLPILVITLFWASNYVKSVQPILQSENLIVESVYLSNTRSTDIHSLLFSRIRKTNTSLRPFYIWYADRYSEK